MKSFDDLANPHKARPPRKRRRAPTKNPNPPKLKEVDKTRCQIVPLVVRLFPELLEHSFRIDPINPHNTYIQILSEAGKLRKELLNLL